MLEPVSVNLSHVVHETIDGETILIHLKTGSYFSLDGVGSEVWVAMAAGTTPQALLAAAAERYTGDPAEVESGLEDLVAELLREGLVVAGEDPATAEAPQLPPGQIPFVRPVLHVYTDMQEFMLVDPLHDVDEVAGWPHAKTD